jgi:SGNH hydrolase-like domain, acetyltransferase AlgX
MVKLFQSMAPKCFFQLRFRLALTCILVPLLFTSCQVQEKGSSEPAVFTLNPKYNRLHSHVLVRRVRVPTEGFLDYAAYVKNVMLIDPKWHAVHPPQKISLTSLSFDGKLAEVKSLLDFTPLTESEKSQPLAWTPVLEHLLKWNFEKATKLSNAYASITGEKWGDTTKLSSPYQEFSSVYIHTNGNLKEIWVEIEFKPWLNSFMDEIQDQDHDGFPEAIARLDSRLFTQEMIAEISGDYSNKQLSEPEVLDWARNLANRWHPLYQTELVELKPGMVWPYEESPLQLKTQLSGVWIANPLFILEGRPFEDTLFNTFVVDGMGLAKTAQQNRMEGKVLVRGIDKGLDNKLDKIMASIDAQLQNYGKGKWSGWVKTLAPFQADIRRFGEQERPDIQGLVAENNILVLRRELEYLLAAKLESTSATRQPMNAIIAFKDYLASLGIDFLFVPIPTKLDLYPEIISTTADILPGQIPQPFLLKLNRDLAEVRVETVDLLEPFQKLKAASETGKRALYQRQDSRWTTVGLETAAQILAERIRLYTWYDEVFRDKRDYRLRDSIFDNLGDTQARLTDAKQAKFLPEQVLGRQVLETNGTFYEDSDSSAVLVIGDSYTGVFETVGCRHAGITAHLARGLGAPVDLIMDWGNGPEALSKLKKRGDGYLKNKRLVVWMMSARDLFVSPEAWSVK